MDGAFLILWAGSVVFLSSVNMAEIGQTIYSYTQKHKAPTFLLEGNILNVWPFWMENLHLEFSKYWWGKKQQQMPIILNTYIYLLW